jgi:predicted nucleic acid-binding protein
VAGFIERITSYRRIGIDTAAFIYQFEHHPVYSPLTSPLFQAVKSGQISAVTSVITVMEVSVLPFRQNKPAIARDYELTLVNYPHLQIATINREIARYAGQLRAEFRLSVPDALQAATVLRYHATALVTNDLQLRRLSPLLDVFILDDFTTV